MKENGISIIYMQKYYIVLCTGLQFLKYISIVFVVFGLH